MSGFSIIDHGNENTRVFESRSEADEKAKGVKQMVSDPSDIEVVKGSYDDYDDYTEAPPTEEVNAEVIDHSPDATPPSEQAEETAEAIDKLGESLEDDPLNILPGHMKDTIQGQPAINKRGYAMIAERYGVEVQAHIESYPWDNEEGRCVARAHATTEDGKEYQDYATACKGDGDMPEQLIELASTRALKRVTSWATGLGIVAYEELADQL